MASSFSSVVELLLSVFRFLTDLFSRKRDEKAELLRLIEEKQAELDAAIDDGRITDIEMLREQLKKLKERYGSKEGGAAGVAVLAFLLAVGPVSQGCFSSGGKPSSPGIIVVGERVNVVHPGDTVPELIPPAKTWYLVDSEAMKSWLNVTWSLERSEVAE